MTSAAACRTLAWDDIAEGMTAGFDFVVDDAAMTDFACLSGDSNPLHCDDGFAQAKGYAGRVVYGALLTVQLSRLVGMELPGRDGVFIGFTVSFRRPVYVGQTVSLLAEVVQTSPGTGAIVMSYKMRADGKVAASGTVDAILKHG